MGTQSAIIFKCIAYEISCVIKYDIIVYYYYYYDIIIWLYMRNVFFSQSLRIQTKSVYCRPGRKM